MKKSMDFCLFWTTVGNNAPEIKGQVNLSAPSFCYLLCGAEEISNRAVTSMACPDNGPKNGQKNANFVYFLLFPWARDWSQRLLLALRFDFPSKMCDSDAYLPSYITFHRFCQAFKP